MKILYALLLLTSATFAYGVDKTVKASSGNLLLDASTGSKIKAQKQLNVGTIGTESGDLTLSPTGIVKATKQLSIPSFSNLSDSTSVIVADAGQGNCSYNFSTLGSRVSVIVTTGLYNDVVGVPYSAMYLYTSGVSGSPIVRTILGSDAPGNNNGAISWSGSTLNVTTGGIGGNCRISYTRI